MSYQAYNNEVEVESVMILDENNSLIIDLATIYGDGKIALDFITLTESLASPMMDGSLVFDGTQGDYEFMQLVGNETLRISLKTPDQKGVETQSITLPAFSIYGFQDSSNFAETNKTPEGFTTRKVTINFCSKDAKELNETPDLLPTGFIGKISSGLTSQPGLVEIIGEYLDGGIDSEATLNDVWIKPELISLPHRKVVEGMNTLQMLNYCKGYSVSASNPSAVNYCFWQDLEGFHFKSIDLISYDARFQTEFKTFSLNSNIIDKNRIYRFDVISDFSFPALLSNNALYSYYYRYEPDYYSSPYARLMDDREKFTKKKIIYNYKDVYANLYPIESEDPFPFITKEDLEDMENDELSVNDVMFGYQSDRSFNDQDKIRSVLLRGNELEISGGSCYEPPADSGGGEEPFTSTEGVSGCSTNLNTNLSHFNAYETNKWQSMFDCVDMEAETLKKIITEIKIPTFKAKREYRDRLAYKEQWNIYKHSVCCVTPSTKDTGIMAVIKRARCIGRNIYRYAWNEVIFIPKAELYNFAGATTEWTSSGYYDTITQLNDHGFSGGSDWDNLKILKNNGGETLGEWDDITSSLTIGDLCGQIFIQGTTCGITFENENAVTRMLQTYLGCGLEGYATGFDLVFHNDKWSPFLVVEKPDGLRGREFDWRGAYNLNEVLNKVTYNPDIFPDLEIANWDSLLHYQDFGDLDEPPGDDDEVDVLIGPGMNANKDHTDYPKGFASMPVGSYQRLNTDDDGYAEDVVKIQSVQSKDLPAYGIDIKTRMGLKTIYYFNATNAQDGNCTTASPCPIGTIGNP